jgi:hypothetical protein
VGLEAGVDAAIARRGRPDSCCGGPDSRCGLPESVAARPEVCLEHTLSPAVRLGVSLGGVWTAVVRLEMRRDRQFLRRRLSYFAIRKWEARVRYLDKSDPAPVMSHAAIRNSHRQPAMCQYKGLMSSPGPEKGD